MAIIDDFIQAWSKRRATWRPGPPPRASLCNNHAQNQKSIVLSLASKGLTCADFQIGVIFLADVDNAKSLVMKLCNIYN
ncbi:unnamed protein product [Lactuca virosa]|uniref:Uncharacterized protein n=1 Tax=Lactuca virosa TaxID=75947 RepID=A0AAU9PVZ6_9ASTR|nr:unnamed protein product [Lactuca virosa]